MSSTPNNVLLLKSAGNTHVKNGDFVTAIDCYDQALKRTKSLIDAVPLLLNRCHARLQSQQYDSALADAIAVIDMSQGNPPEKALFRASRALYGLQRWQECLNYLDRLISIYPSNSSAHQEIVRCKTRLRETKGDYDFVSMLKEVNSKSPTPDMDRASYIGPIAVRECAIKSHGRGLFTTRAVEAGEMLLCEKAFAAVFPPSYGDPAASLITFSDQDKLDETRELALKRRHCLVKRTFNKLALNPSLGKGFLDLYGGPDRKTETDGQSGLPVVDESFIEDRIIYNNFGFPIRTHEYHYCISHTPELADDLCESRGVWVQASYINHSCYPMVRRSFIGDMMIFRAQQNIPADTELKFGYISGLEELDERQSKLKNYGFDCDCQICNAEKHTSGKKMKRRLAICGEMFDIFEKGESNSLQKYTDLLDQMEATYVNPPSVEYRRAMITPLTNIITGCITSGLPLQVIELTHRLLRALGFEFEVTTTSFRIKQWGFLLDEVVVSMVDLCEAYEGFDPRLLRDAEEVAKKGYLIVCGEDVSWEEAYGKGGKGKGKTRSGMPFEERTEDLVEEVGKMTFV